MKRRAIFLDRDGTVTKEGGYINHPLRIELERRSASAIRLLNELNIPVILVTNQAGVARGYFDEKMIELVHNEMNRQLAEDGAKIDKIYYCPHHPEVGSSKYRKDCECRKPKDGMLKKAEKELNIDLSSSYMIGDRIKDVEMGKNSGLKSILVLTGYGRGEFEFDKEKWKIKPDFICKDIFEAVIFILKDLKIF